MRSYFLDDVFGRFAVRQSRRNKQVARQVACEDLRPRDRKRTDLWKSVSAEGATCFIQGISQVTEQGNGRMLIVALFFFCGGKK